MALVSMDLPLSCSSFLSTRNTSINEPTYGRTSLPSSELGPRFGDDLVIRQHVVSSHPPHGPPGVEAFEIVCFRLV